MTEKELGTSRDGRAEGESRLMAMEAALVGVDVSMRPTQRPLSLLEAQAAYYQRYRQAASTIDVAAEIAALDTEIAGIDDQLQAATQRGLVPVEDPGGKSPAQHDLEAEFSVGLSVELGLESLMKTKHEGGEPSVLQRLVL